MQEKLVSFTNLGPFICFLGPGTKKKILDKFLVLILQYTKNFVSGLHSGNMDGFF
jgi:hypothetical protein